LNYFISITVNTKRNSIGQIRKLVTCLSRDQTKWKKYL